MTGERFYNLHRGCARDLMGATLETWESLSRQEQASWDAMAFEQELRDRPRPMGVSYDGPYTD